MTPQGAPLRTKGRGSPFVVLAMLALVYRPRALPLGLALLALGLVTSDVSAQGWGLTMERGMSRGMSRGMTRGMSRGTRGMSRGMRASMSRMSSMSTDASTAEGASRTEVLIARYEAILARNPTEGFAFQRLLDLYRERDGQIGGFERELRERIAADADDYVALMLLGHVHKAQGRQEDALSQYRRAAEVRPREAGPHAAVGQVARSLGQVEPARVAFRAALERTNDPEARRDLERSLGELALEAEDWDAARTRYDRLARGAGDSIYVRTEFARALAERGQPTRAVVEYERVLRQLRGDRRVLAPVLRDMGAAQVAAGQVDEAIATYQRALQVAGRSAGIRREIYEALADAYRRGERLAELVEELAGARDAAAAELRAKVLDELGRDEEALEAYRAVLRRDRRNIDARVRVVQLLSRSGRLEDVVAEYRELVRVAPREPRFVIELAQLLMDVGDREQALALAARTSRQNPREPAIHQALAELYARWDEHELATAEVARLVRIDPRDPAHLIALGEQQLDAGSPELALRTWARILAAESERARGYATLAAVLMDHAMVEYATAAWRQAVELEPERTEYLRGLAHALEQPRDQSRSSVPAVEIPGLTLRANTGPGGRESGTDRARRDNEAAELWGRVLRSTEDRAHRREARRRIVGIWTRRGELGPHLASWRQSFDATPPDNEAGRFLAEAYLRQRPRQLVRAEAVLNELTTREPGDVESLLALERVRHAQGNLDGVVEVLARLVERDPRHAAQYLQRMAERSLALYRDEDAVRFAEQAVARAPNDADAHRRLGELYRARQQPERAAASYRRAIELNDRLFATYFDLAELELARGRFDEASRLYRAVLRLSPDDELVSRAGSASLQIHLGRGELAVLEADLLPLALARVRRPIFRRLLIELYDQMTVAWIGAIDRGEEAPEAREQLVRLGARALKPLLEALADDDPAQRRVAIDILGHVANPAATAPLIAAAESDAPIELRRRALVGAGAVADAEFVPRFEAFLEGDERRLRPIAAWALARIAAPNSRNTLVAALRSGDPITRMFAVLGLARTSAGRRDRAAQLAAIREQLERDGASAVRAGAAMALALGGDEDAGGLLVEYLHRADGYVARAVVRGLAVLSAAERDERARAALLDRALQSQGELQDEALAALLGGARSPLERLPPPTGSFDAASYVDGLLAASFRRPSNAAILGFLSERRSDVVLAVRSALSGSRERVDGVLLALDSDDPRFPIGFGSWTRGAAALPDEARPLIVALAVELAPALAELMDHPLPDVRLAAIRRLDQMGRLEGQWALAEASLSRALADDDPRVVRAALHHLARRGELGDALRPGVIAIARTQSSWTVRREATLALAGAEGPEVEAALVERLQEDEYAFVREAAALALGERASAARADAAREDPDPRVRAAAR